MRVRGLPPLLLSGVAPLRRYIMRKWELPEFKAPAEAPHRVVGKMLNSIGGSAKGVGESVVGGLKGAGGGIAEALDKPFHSLTGKSGPHQIVDRLLDGVADATNNAGASAIGTIQILGEGISKALDHPWDQLK